MKLWKLKTTEDEINCYSGFVVRAETEAKAREIVASCKGVDPEWTCEELRVDGTPGIILSDFYNA